MANLKEVRTRMGSVKSTQQITKAMKMVSAAKLKRAVDATHRMQPYAEKLLAMLERVRSELAELENPYTAAREIKKVLLVVVTSNRGLAGAFNTNLIRLVTQRIKIAYSSLPSEHLLVLAVGKKGFEYFQRSGYPIAQNFSEIFADLNNESATAIADTILEGYLAGRWDKVELFFNHFKNAASQEQRRVDLLPATLDQKKEVAADLISGSPMAPANPERSSHGLQRNYIFEPDLSALMEYLIPESIRANLYSALLNSFASEHGARMTSMDKATENAGELLKALRLQYNRARQASITNEILEIVSGANALAAV